jgi:bacterioferritin B
MPADRFVAALNDQIGREFGASQQYLAAAVWYEDETLPRLAQLFYDQAVEERGHGLMMAKYLLDLNVRPRIPGVSEPSGEFTDFVEPIKIALEQEQKVTQQISELTKIAREENDFVSEEFTHWFLKEQVEEIDLMSTLLDAAERVRDRPLDLEDFIAREGIGGGQAADPTAPTPAGG